jgi:site-specific DNA recombinase
LLTEGEVFENEILSRTESTDNPAQKMPEGNSHGKNLIETSQIELVVKLLILRVFDPLANDSVQAQLRGDNQGRRHGIKANSTSLLVGLLEDAKGNRFTPSHTSKNGRRYRYYVCQMTTHGCGRMPAHDVERQVCLKLRSFLQSGRKVMDALGLPEDPPARTQQLIAAAVKQSDEWLSASPAAVQDFVRKVVRRVVVHPDRVEVEVGKRKLRATLTGDPHAPRPAIQKLEQGSCDVIRLAIAARIKRCGNEMRLVLPPDRLSQAPSHPASSLLKALARGRKWYEWVVAGEVTGRRSIGQKLGLDERYAGRVLECAFLAPDIVEAILDGRQPSDLTFEKLTRRLPLSWIEQRRRLGFPPLEPTAIDHPVLDPPLLRPYQGIDSLIPRENSLFVPRASPPITPAE